MARAPRKSKITTAQTAEEPVETKRVATKRFGEIVTIPGVRTRELSALIIGTQPLMVHNFADKYRQKILRRHMGEASEGQEPKDPIANFEGAKYVALDGWEGMPAAGVKGCIVEAFGKGSDVAMTRAKGAVFVRADGRSTQNIDLVKLIYPTEPPAIVATPHFPNELNRVPRCREDVVRNDTGVVDIRHRPEYWPWAALVRVEFLPSVCSERQLLQAIAMSGFRVGLCEWRPKSKKSLTGHLGMFRIATAAEIEAFERDELFADHEWRLPAALQRAAE
jgi:hypothetical protein